MPSPYSGSLRTKTSVSEPVRSSSAPTPFLPQELKKIRELERKIGFAGENTSGSVADLKKELALINDIAKARVQMLKYCNSPVLGKSLVEEFNVDSNKLDIDHDETEQFRKGYSNWRQGGAVGSSNSIKAMPLAMPTTIYLRSSKKTTNIDTMSFFGVDAALYGTPKNTEPMFPTYNSVIGHIASMR
eukprot:CAMPEP_0114332892 /NCGR_PEP_ID=MMETSP0101-20121206/3401_1 /TAXON_ID=38822 ORGANISM="Pteridomonas danica, Strain PT" /NCGR_SAMPLE_ID=MMETSP0101 /ASSEMBLY_ACC=CAM_ASM_000211 /LENGTH=186 /DNA_ID=CAMNT_0001463749 /DNA_START=39 /DNA_END=599 /DNA_ORIENTATION=+